MRVALQDGRKLEVPLAWFPRLREATPEQLDRAGVKMNVQVEAA